MAAEFEELKLTVNLTDTTTAAGFTRLRQAVTGVNTDLSNLNEAAKKVDFRRAGEAADKVGTMIKGLSREISNALTRISYVGPMLRGLQPQIEGLVEKAIPKWARVPVFLGLVAAAVAEAIKALTGYLNEFAHATLEFESIAKEIGVSVGTLRVLRDSMGVSIGRDAATKSIRNFNLAMQQIRRGTERFYEVARNAGPTAANMMQFNNKLIALLDQGKNATALKEIRDEARKQEEQYRAMGFSEDQIARMLNNFLGVYGQNRELMEVEDFHEPTADEQKQQEELARQSRLFAEQYNKLSIEMGKVFDAIKVELLPLMTELLDYLNANPDWADKFAKGVHDTATTIKEGYELIRPLLDAINSGTPGLPAGEEPGAPPMIVPGQTQQQRDFVINRMNEPVQFGDLGGGGNGGWGDVTDALDDNTAELKRVNANLYQLLNLRQDQNGNISIGGGGAPIGGGGGGDTGTTSPGSTSPRSSTPPTSNQPSTPPTAPTAPAGPPQTTVYPDPNAQPSVPLAPPAVNQGPSGPAREPLAPEPGLNPAPMSSQSTVGAGNSGSTPAAVGGGDQGGAGTVGNPADAASKPRYNQPSAPTGPLGLRDQRMNKYGADFANPAMREKFLSYVNAETGGQGPVAQQAFIETILNRGMARGETLDQVLSNKAYFPDRTRRVAARGLKESERNAMSPLLETAMGGSNISNFATGNAQEDPKHPFGKAGMFGFGGTGGATFMVGSGGTGTEYFGTEKADQAWVETQRELALLDRQAIDYAGGQQIAGSVSGAADVKVKVERPSGPAVLEADANMFLPTPTNRQVQMPLANSGPPSQTVTQPAVATQ